MSDLTTHDLLRHHSGIRSNSDELTLAELQGLIEKGARDADWRMGRYDNSNFALFHVILPYMVYGHKVAEADTTPSAAQRDLKSEVADLQKQLQKATGSSKAALAGQIKALQAKLAKLPKVTPLDRKTGEMYIAYVQDHVLKPVGLGGTTIAPRANVPDDAVTSYDFKNPLTTAPKYHYA